MLLLELEQQVKPLNRQEKFQLIRYLLDVVAAESEGEIEVLTDEDRHDIQRFDERLNEPDRPLSDYLAERARRAGRGYQAAQIARVLSIAHRRDVYR